MKFRTITVSYYDVDPDKLETNYGTDDPVEAALIDQENFRDDGSALVELLNEPGVSDAEIYVQVFDPDQQMFPDEALREFIQILRVDKFEIHIDHEATNKDQQVHFRLEGVIEYSPCDYEKISLESYGRTMGYALRSVREQLRALTGK